MWFLFSLCALLCWSGSDLFSKIGCSDGQDKKSHLKMLFATGIIMGIHAMYSLSTGKVNLSVNDILKYLPVSALYILSMAIGYLGLRYIELSISSPICNSSGAIVAVLSIAIFGFSEDIPKTAVIPVILVIAGVILMGFTEYFEDDEIRRQRQQKANRVYAKSALALLLPVIYCVLDALGTFADSIVLQSMDEMCANTAYELTFLTVGLVCGIYVFLIKKDGFKIKKETPKLIGAVFETVGQFFYIFALADTKHVAFSAPLISSYCVVSIIWSSIVLKEKLSTKHYLSITLVIIGIIILGVFDI